MLLLETTTPEVLSEEERQRRDLSLERRALISKMASLNTQLQNLLQKKIRIDLEIRRTRTKLSRLKERSSTTMKTSIRLEGIDPDQQNPLEYTEILRESLSNEEYLELSKLDQELDRSEEMLTEISDLPLYED